MTTETKKHEEKKRPPLTKTIVLEFDTDSAGVKIGSLSMRRPTVKDRLNAEAYTGSDLTIDMMMIANLCEVEPKAIEGLYWSDYVKCQEAMRELMGFTVPRTI